MIYEKPVVADSACCSECDSSEGAGTTAVWDRTHLASLLEGDEALIREILSDSVEIISADVEILCAALVAGEIDTVLRIAHRLKGAAANIGAGELANLAEEVEKSVRKTCGQFLTEQSSRLRTASEKLVEILCEACAK